MSTVGLTFPFLSRVDGDGSRSFFSRFVAQDLAMDLGTANTLIYARGEGILVNEPSILAISDQGSTHGKVIAVGHEAKKMFGKTSGAVRFVRPLKDGVIADFSMAAYMIKHLIARVHRGLTLFRPRIVIGIPSGITQVEKRAVIDAALTAGVRQVLLVEEPVAAALGADLPIEKPIGNMIVDIGGGTTEVAILSLNGAVYSQSIRVAGDGMDEAIQRAVRKELGVQIGIFEAERIKLVLGCALRDSKERERIIEADGRDIATSSPLRAEVSESLVQAALSEPLFAISHAIHLALEKITPEISHDVMTRGVYLTGGGSLLRGLDRYLKEDIGIPFIRTPDPLSCVARGVGRISENLSEYRNLCIA